jgi:hypothetical protein
MFRVGEKTIGKTECTQRRIKSVRLIYMLWLYVCGGGGVILKRGKLLVDLKYATRVTVRDKYIIVKLVDSEDVVKVSYSGDWTPEILVSMIVAKKNLDGYYLDLDGGEENGDNRKVD